MTNLMHVICLRIAIFFLDMTEFFYVLGLFKIGDFFLNIGDWFYYKYKND